MSHKVGSELKGRCVSEGGVDLGEEVKKDEGGVNLEADKPDKPEEKGEDMSNKYGYHKDANLEKWLDNVDEAPKRPYAVAREGARIVAHEVLLQLHFHLDLRVRILHFHCHSDLCMYGLCMYTRIYISFPILF